MKNIIILIAFILCFITFSVGGGVKMYKTKKKKIILFSMNDIKKITYEEKFKCRLKNINHQEDTIFNQLLNNWINSCNILPNCYMTCTILILDNDIYLNVTGTGDYKYDELIYSRLKELLISQTKKIVSKSGYFYQLDFNNNVVKSHSRMIQVMK